MTKTAARATRTRSKGSDFLDEMIAERTKVNPGFARLLAEAEARRRFARRLAAVRVAKALSQTAVATKMGTSASVVSKLEQGGDVKLSTFRRYVDAIGEKLQVA